jgi:hypothetical protein
MVNQPRATKRPIRLDAYEFHRRIGDGAAMMRSLYEGEVGERRLPIPLTRDHCVGSGRGCDGFGWFGCRYCLLQPHERRYSSSPLLDKGPGRGFCLLAMVLSQAS